MDKMKRKGEFIPKQKVCKNCKSKFTAIRPLQSSCSYLCAIALVKQQKAKSWKKEKKEIVEKLKTRGEHLNELQTIFNTFIRLRDKDLPCISCGTTANVQYHAGHYWNVGSYPGVRFNEHNVNKQCGNNCNKNQGGNKPEYEIGLRLKIGNEAFEQLKADREKPLKLILPEIIELKKYYREKIKELMK